MGPHYVVLHYSFGPMYTRSTSETAEGGPGSGGQETLRVENSGFVEGLGFNGHVFILSLFLSLSLALSLSLSIARTMHIYIYICTYTYIYVYRHVRLWF